MTKQEAIAEMKAGKRLTHRFFADHEWVTMPQQGHCVQSEDGIKQNAAGFWSLRTGEEWQIGWEIFKDPER